MTDTNDAILEHTAMDAEHDAFFDAVDDLTGEALAQTVCEEMHLSEHQTLAVKEVWLSQHTGGGILLTGGAGVGKSYVVRAIAELFRRSGTSTKLLKCAPTGMAAMQINGETANSLFNLGLADSDLEHLVANAIAHGKAENIKRIANASVCVVDEVSMVTPHLLNAMNAVAKKARGRPDVPFGGLFMVLVGDFMQLKPVINTKNGYTNFNEGATWAFQSKAYRELKPKPFILEQQFRQDQQGEFLQVLNRIRMGEMRIPDDFRYLNRRRDAILALPPGIVPTHLHAKNVEVNQENRARLDELETPSFVFVDDTVVKKKVAVGPTGPEYRSLCDLEAEGKVHLTPAQHCELARQIEYVRSDRNTRASANLELKVGAQVMCVVNLPDSGLVNGSTGKVVAFTPDPSKAGGGALSCTKHQVVVEFPKPENSKESFRVTLSAFTWKYDIILPPDFKGGECIDLCIWYTQLPVTLAWALTIHKGQGSTLTHVKANLSKCFDDGHAYVALSRCTSEKGLTLPCAVQTGVIKTSELAKQFYLNGCKPMPLRKTGEIEAAFLHASELGKRNNGTLHSEIVAEVGKDIVAPAKGRRSLPTKKTKVN